MSQFRQVRNSRMKQLIIFIFLCLTLTMFGQAANEPSKGIVSYVSSQNVYVQFVNTDGIELGDTLYSQTNDMYIPALIVKEKSSISCLCIDTNDYLPAVRNQVFAKLKSPAVPVEVAVQNSKQAVSVNELAISGSKSKISKDKSSIDGRVSLSSYLNNTSDTTMNSIFRLNLSLNANHIANSKFSAECYMSVTKKNTYTPYTSTVDSTTITNYRIDQPLDIKIYNLAVKYELPDSMSVLFGRKINPNLANIGAVDGLQFEKTGKTYSYGAVIGSRPDTYTYNINPGLLQYGAYVSHQMQKGNSYMQTSLAFFNQMNNMQTDRRFIYLQHSNSLLKNLDLFCSFELDLYGAKNQTNSAIVKNILGNDSTVSWNTRTPINMLDLTSAYISLNYRPFKNVSLGLSYDARKNVYYYETYKNYIDSVLDKETRQGLRFNARYQPFKFLTWGGNAGYRFATATSGESYNGYTYLTFPRLPFETQLTIDVTALKASYLSGMIYGASLTKDLLDGKIFTELSYRNVNYTTPNGATTNQNIGEMSLSWRITKKLMLWFDYEATFNPDNNYQGRAFINLSQRF